MKKRQIPQGHLWIEIRVRSHGSCFLLRGHSLGLFNMHGNVWEWTEDCYQVDYDDAPTNGAPQLHDPLGDFDGTLRGGSWLDRPKRLRSAARQVGARDDRNYGFGFRVVLTL